MECIEENGYPLMQRHPAEFCGVSFLLICILSYNHHELR